RQMCIVDVTRLPGPDPGTVVAPGQLTEPGIESLELTPLDSGQSFPISGPRIAIGQALTGSQQQLVELPIQPLIRLPSLQTLVSATMRQPAPGAHTGDKSCEGLAKGGITAHIKQLMGKLVKNQL